MKPADPRSRRKVAPGAEKTLYVVATVHLDTQWRWTVQDTIRDFLPATLEKNFALFERFPFFTLSFEGAFRYMLVKEYYPEDFERLKEWIRKGRWHVAGSMLDSPDVNVVSPESLIRHILYGNGFFSREFGRTSEDIFLPDCFGFSQALPSVAAHCGLRGFSSQKFGKWSAPAKIPFDVGIWEGPDGASIVAALRPEGYGEGLSEDLTHADRWIERLDAQEESSGLAIGFMYVGVGDRGGALSDDSMRWLAASHHGDGPVRILQSSSDQIFRDLDAQETASLSRYRGELLLPTHGTGCLTSQAAMKRWNRRNESLATAAERAAVAAHWLGLADYPRERLKASWHRFLWHQMHDDITGTSIPEAYRFSWNDQLIALNQFSAVLTSSVAAISANLDTEVEGVPLVVYNPLPREREDVVEARVRFPQAAPSGIEVYDSQGLPVPAQIVNREKATLDIVFLARVSPLGFHVYDVRPGPARRRTRGDLQVDENSLENHRYRVAIDERGDICSLFDKSLGVELLSGPISLDLLPDRSALWPAWEIRFDDVMARPLASIKGPCETRIVENGPARVALEIRRSTGASRIVQWLRLSAGEAGDRLEVAHRIDWRERGRLLKATFRLRSAHSTATYDLGLGVIARGNNTRAKYEVPAQQWADLSSPELDFGVSIMNDGKYGWDKPDDGTLRLSLLRSPRVGRKFRHQGIQDLGRHEFTFAVSGHRGTWNDQDTGSAEPTDAQAERLNQPLLAFSVPAATGRLGRSFSFAEASLSHTRIDALKLAETSEEVVLRLRETGGEPVEGGVRFAGHVRQAREINGAEGAVSQARSESGRLATRLSPFAVRTFALELAPPESPGTRLECLPVAIPFDLQATSRNRAPASPGFDRRGATYPAELFPARIESGGIEFRLGEADTFNAMRCLGQSLELPGSGRLHLLAAACEEDTMAPFEIGDRHQLLSVQHFSGLIGCWKGWKKRRWGIQRGSRRGDLAWGNPDSGFLKRDTIAWIGTHRHDARGNDEPYIFCYLFHYTLDIPERARRVCLPEAASIRIFAATVADDRDRDVQAATELYRL